MKTRFIVYGLIGWIVETLWTGLGSLLSGNLTMYAWTYIWMFPIYGLMVFLEPVHNRIRHLPLLIRGITYTVLIFGIEYSTGWILSILIGKCPWNYGNGPYSIGGIITLAYIPVWFLGGLIFEKLHDFLVDKGIGELKRNTDNR